jgi:ABC-type Fe3+-hydroxamate transport system substrate-binding protein
MGGLISGIRVLSCAVILTVLACRQPELQSSRLVVVDDAGDSVAVHVPARRVVSLIPASTELLFAIGAGPVVVGRSEWCDYPPAVSAVPNLGAGIGPNLEAVLAARPDLVVLYNSAQHAAVASRLRDLGVPAIRINTDGLADVPRIGGMLGRLTGHQREADSLSAVFDTALASATVDSGSVSRPTVLLLVWEQPPMTVGRGSFLSELVERAGGRNLFADVATSSGPVSIEAVSVRDPDLILTTAAGPAAFASRPEWQAVRAVREKRFLAVSGSRYDRPGPRSPAAIRALAGRLRDLAR